jgi:beta-glucan synthesis-associated protein KRE6
MRPSWPPFLVALLAAGAARGGWIDPDTLDAVKSVASFRDGSRYDLVMSDEFNVENRTFADGEDPTWTAMDHSDDAR